jgi:hypothetical protein
LQYSDSHLAFVSANKTILINDPSQTLQRHKFSQELVNTSPKSLLPRTFTRCARDRNDRYATRFDSCSNSRTFLRRL